MTDAAGLCCAYSHYRYNGCIGVNMNGWPFRPDGKGNVEQLIRGQWKPLIGSKDNVGYHMATWVAAGPGRRFKRVHVIVWLCYNQSIPPDYEIDHIDGNKSNNNIANLRLLTNAENMRAARERIGNWNEGKLKPWQVALVLALPAGWECLHQLAARWDVSKFHLGNLRNRAKTSNDSRYIGTL
jgi:hypothetical protein